MDYDEAWIDRIENEDIYNIVEEDVLDDAELNRIARKAEHPEQTDPVFLFIRGGAR